MAESIDKLRDELHGYHVDVQRQIQRCKDCRDDVVKLQADVYGLSGNDASKGIKGDVADLKHSRRLLTWGLRAIWSVMSLLGVGAFTAWIRSR